MVRFAYYLPYLMCLWLLACSGANPPSNANNAIDVSNNLNTLEIWPIRAKAILDEKHISTTNLQNTFSSVIFPWDDNYDQQRMLYYLQIQERPLFIIQAHTEADVTAALDLLKTYALSIRIVGGRHSTGIQSPQVYLDVSAINSLSFDANTGVLVAGGGATQGSANTYLADLQAEHYFSAPKAALPTTSFEFPGGSSLTVGVSGLTSVGGVGTLRRTMGLTVDTVESIRIALAPTQSNASRVVTASGQENTDLFWALLGGGAANFGVVTQIQYKLPKVGSVVVYTITFPWEPTTIESAFNSWQTGLATLPKAYTEDFGMFAPGEGQDLSAEVFGIYVAENGQSEADAKTTIAAQRADLANKGKLQFESMMAYAKAYQKIASGRTFRNFGQIQGIFAMTQANPQEVMQQIEKAKNLSAGSGIGFEAMGGQILENDASKTSFFARNALFFVDIYNYWDDQAQSEINHAWGQEAFSTLYASLGPYVYLGFPIMGLPDYLHAYYGSNAERLQTIKQAIDPLGLLKFPWSL